jgi:foldase protein PrsA
MRALVRYYGDRALEGMIQQLLIRQEARKLGIAVEPKEADQALEDFYSGRQFRQELPLSERRRLWTESLASRGMTEDDFKEQLEVELLLKKLVLRRVNVTDEQVHAEFLRRHGERLELRQIIVKTQPEADEISQQIKNGASFIELARTKSIDRRTGIDGGKLPQPLARGTKDFVYEDVAFHLAVGQVSPPFQVQDGWCILKLEGRLPPADVKLEDVKEKYRQELIAAEQGRLTPQVLRELVQNADIQRGPVSAPAQENK